MLQQDDRLGIANAAIGHHRHNFIKRDFEDVNILALVMQAAALARAMITGDFSNKKMQAFGDPTPGS